MMSIEERELVSIMEPAELNSKQRAIRESFRTKRKHGTFINDTTRWHCCIHEACHAVMAMKLGFKVNSVSVYRFSMLHNMDKGSTDIAGIGITKDTDAAMMIALGGIEVTVSALVNRNGLYGDESYVLYGRPSRGRLLDMVDSVCSSILEDSGTILALADALYHEGTISSGLGA